MNLSEIGLGARVEIDPREQWLRSEALADPLEQLCRIDGLDLDVSRARQVEHLADQSAHAQRLVPQSLLGLADARREAGIPQRELDVAQDRGGGIADFVCHARRQAPGRGQTLALEQASLGLEQRLAFAHQRLGHPIEVPAERGELVVADDVDPRGQVSPPDAPGRLGDALDRQHDAVPQQPGAERDEDDGREAEPPDRQAQHGQGAAEQDLAPHAPHEHAHLPAPSRERRSEHQIVRREAPADQPRRSPLLRREGGPHCGNAIGVGSAASEEPALRTEEPPLGGKLFPGQRANERAEVGEARRSGAGEPLELAGAESQPLRRLALRRPQRHRRHAEPDHRQTGEHDQGEARHDLGLQAGRPPPATHETWRIPYSRRGTNR